MLRSYGSYVNDCCVAMGCNVERSRSAVVAVYVENGWCSKVARVWLKGRCGEVGRCGF